jgi:biopolymer transport protein ExbB/TolQ
LQEIIFFFEKGGILFYPLSLLGLVIFYFGFYQIYFCLKCNFKAPNKKPDCNFIWAHKAYIMSESGTGFKGATLIESLEICLNKVEEQMGRKLSTMRFCGQVSTLMGFLGTVAGMVKTFQAVALKGAATPALLAGGICEALFTTIFGLVLAIIAAGFAHIIETITRRRIRKLEAEILQKLEIQKSEA